MDAQHTGPTLLFMGGNATRQSTSVGSHRREFTVKEYAERDGVTERTVRRWIEKGAVDYRRTPGGRVRIRDEK
jgi:excisionase family DNA binding protein